MRGFRELDRILRGDAAQAAGQAPDFDLKPVLMANLALAMFYGVCMGIFGVSGREEPEFRHMIADAFKVPLLFVLSLAVTFPSLYVFSALVGSRVRALDLARLATAGLGVLLAVLAAFGPIVGFFSVTTTSYPFVVLMNVAVFTLAAAFGISYLARAVDRLMPRPPVPVARPVRTPTPPAEGGETPAGVEGAEELAVMAPTPSPEAARTVLRIWLAGFALVGAQMSWVLRPFIGSPTREFTWFRPRDASFFEAVVRAVRALLTGE